MKIYNQTSVTFSPETQQEILKAMAHCGASEVCTVLANENTGANIFDFYADGIKSVYLFSIDTDGDVIFER